MTGTQDVMKTMCGTFQYIAPEIIYHSALNPNHNPGEDKNCVSSLPSTNGKEIQKSLIATDINKEKALRKSAINGYGKAVDCWSLGTMLYVMLTGIFHRLYSFLGGRRWIIIVLGTQPFNMTDDENDPALLKMICAGKVIYSKERFEGISKEGKFA